MMLTNKAKQQGAKPIAQRKVAETPKLDALIAKRDYVGAITLLEFELQSQRDAHSASGWQHNPTTGEYEWVAGGAQPPRPDASTEEVRRLLWLAYAAFHCGDFKKVRGAGPHAAPDRARPRPRRRARCARDGKVHVYACRASAGIPTPRGARDGRLGGSRPSSSANPPPPPPSGRYPRGARRARPRRAGSRHVRQA